MYYTLRLKIKPAAAGALKSYEAHSECLNMAHSYTPGLRVSRSTRIRKERRLPLKGEVKVKVGDQVSALQVIADTKLPGNVHPLNCAGQLGIIPADIHSALVVKLGDAIRKDQVIAVSKSFFGLFSSKVTSPIDGVLESASPVTGQLILREAPIPVEVSAYLDGHVTQVFPEEGVEVETAGAFIQGIFGIAGERYGKIAMAVDSPDQPLEADHITEAHKGCIVIGGSMVTLEAYRKAEKVGAVAIVCGGMHNIDLKKLLGYEQGVAITGQEDLVTTLVLTEGFGRIAMARRTFELLAENNKRMASVSGATQIRAGVIRPEVIIPHDDLKVLPQTQSEVKGLEMGDVLRVIRQPYFGAIGKLTGLPSELQLLETGACVRVLELEIEGGERIILPRANVEIIES